MGRWIIGSAALAIVAACADEAALSPQGEDRAPAQPRAEMAKAPDPRILPEALKGGDVSPRAVVGTYLRRIELLDQSGPQLQSVLLVNPDAVSVAKSLEAARASGVPSGKLYGLPLLIKDNIETREMPTTAGSLALTDNDTGRDAPAVARLRAEDAVILGKTNLSEWANFRSSWSISGWSAVGGLTRNPHDLARNPCGSSSGSAVAVAAGLAWAALGTETNGSIICPAASQGVVGFKPTVGLVSRRYVVPLAPSQDTIGPITTSVRDAALLLSVMAGTDAADPATKEADGRKTDYVAALKDASLDGVRIGVLRWAEAANPRERAVFASALRLAEAAGAVLIDINEGPQTALGDDSFFVLKAAFKDSLNTYLAEAAPGVTARTLTDVIAFNNQNPDELALFGQDILMASDATEGMATDDYRRALENIQRATGQEGIDRWFGAHDLDVLIAPSFGPAFLTDLVRGDGVGEPTGAGWMPAIAGYPHLTIPMGEVSGLPLGLSMIGPAWHDAEILTVGQAFERILPPRLNPKFRLSVAQPKNVQHAINR